MVKVHYSDRFLARVRRRWLRRGPMVEVCYSDRLGNWLFQYCLGRILAEQLGYVLAAEPINGFPRTRERVSGASHRSPVKRYERHAIPLEAMLLDPSPRRIVLAGYFQNYRYYAPHAGRIRQWLAWDNAVPDLDDDDHREDLLLHVRLGDLVKRGQALSIDFYTTLLARIPHRRAYLAAEDTSDPLLAPLRAAGVIPLPASLGELGTLRAAGRFGKLVIGQATFGWWMAFLSPSATEIHMGLPDHAALGSASLTRIADGLDLRLDDPRYTYYYRAPLLGTPTENRLTPLPNFCGLHERSTAIQWA